MCVIPSWKFRRFPSHCLSTHVMHNILGIVTSRIFAHKTMLVKQPSMLLVYRLDTRDFKQSASHREIGSQVENVNTVFNCRLLNLASHSHTHSNATIVWKHTFWQYIYIYVYIYICAYVYVYVYMAISEVSPLDSNHESCSNKANFEIAIFFVKIMPSNTVAVFAMCMSIRHLCPVWFDQNKI